MATSFFPEGLSPLTRYNAAQRGTHIRRRNRKRSDGAVAVVRPAAAVIRVLATSSSFDNPFGSDCALAGLFRVMALASRLPSQSHNLYCPNWDSGIRDSHHALEHFPVNQSVSFSLERAR